MEQDLSQIIRDIFTSSGYNIMDSGRADLIAEKNGRRTYVKFGSDPDRLKIQDFSTCINDGVGLYVSTERVSTDLIEYAKNLGLILWDREELAFQIGEAVLADMEGRNVDLELSGPKGAQHPDNVIWQTAVPEPSQTHVAIPAEPAAPNVLDLRSAPLNVSKDRAIAIARPHVSGLNDMILKFVPFWRYSYSVHSEHQFRSKVIDISGEGNGMLNALNGNNESMNIPQIQEQVSVPDEQYDVKMPITKKEDAYNDLLQQIIEDNTRDARFNNTAGEAIISEHKRFKPAKKDIELNVDLVYLPVWEAKGRKNSVEINGYSAEILLNPVDDDVEFI
ncbi:MAG: hypothetical protein U9N13_06400 [Euryarchaeota archaeon]|nr:hypothetical protein [Euryarchaeota archaeon]